MYNNQRKQYTKSVYQKPEQELKATLKKLQETFEEIKRLKEEKHRLKDQLENLKGQNTAQVGYPHKENINNNGQNPQELEKKLLFDEKMQLLNIIKFQKEELQEKRKQLSGISDEMNKIVKKNNDHHSNEDKIKNSHLDVQTSVAKIQIDCEETDKEIMRDQLILDKILEENKKLEEEYEQLCNEQMDIVEQNQNINQEVMQKEQDIKDFQSELTQTFQHLQELVLKNKILNEQLNNKVTQEQINFEQITKMYSQIAKIDELLLQNNQTIQQFDQQLIIS